MANVFFNLPSQAANGSGAAVDVSTLGALKTVLINGTWIIPPIITIEINNDPTSTNGSWTPIKSIQGEGQFTMPIACRWMRATVSDYQEGMAPVVNVGADDSGATFAAIVAPPTNGTGTAVDVAPLPELKTIQVGGTFRGTLIIEISNDGGTTYVQQATFTAPGQQTRSFTADFMRAVREGVDPLPIQPGLPIINVGACDTASGGGGGGGPIEFDNPITPAALPAGDTDDYNPTGLSTTNWIRQAVDADGSTLTGLVAQASGGVRMIENLGPSELVIAHENAGSAAANRFSTPGETDFYVPPGGAATAVYDITAARWMINAISRLAPYLNVRDFGAQGDGITDDREAIQRAMTAAGAVPGSTLLFPPGEYLVGRDGLQAWCLDMPADDIQMQGVYGHSVILQAAGLPDFPISIMRINGRSGWTIRDLVFDGNWGNGVTVVAAASNDQLLPGSAGPNTISLESVDGFTNLVPGIATFRLQNNNYQYVSYTGVDTSTNQLTGCTGGTGRLQRFDPVVAQNTALGINQTTQTDPKNHGLFIRGSHGWLVDHCIFRQNYGDSLWLGAQDPDIDNFTTKGTIKNCTINITARNGISFGAGVYDIRILNNQIRSYWTCGLDSEPQGLSQSNRDVAVHGNTIVPWPIFPGGGQSQAIGIVAGTPAGYNNYSAARGWRVSGNFLYGWTAINNSIDVDFSDNECRTQFNYIGYLNITNVNPGTDTFTTASPHEMITGNGVLQILTDGTLPAGLTPSSGNPLKSIGYYAIVTGASTFKVATTLANAIAGTAVDISGAGSGTIDLTGPQTVAPIFVDHTSDDIRVCRNFVYDNAERAQFAGDGNRGAIEVRMYSASTAAGTVNLQPAGVIVAQNQIHAHNGTHGIYVDSQGGFTIGDNTAPTPPVAGSASNVTGSTMEDLGAGWTVDQWIGWQVIMGGKVGLIASNTAEVITIYTPDLGTNGWSSPTGEPSAIPTLGNYVITNTSGVLTIDDNHIDCGVYGFDTAGAMGIYLAQDRGGSRISVTNNKVKNPTTYGVFVVGGGGSITPFVEIRGNRFWDDQVVPTMTAGINFFDASSLSSITKLIMSDNAMIGGVTTLMTGVAAGTWLLADGTPQEWTGYGSPEGVVTAPIGSTYLRLDGGAGYTEYIKSAGAGNTGWLESSAPQASSIVAAVNIANTETVIASYSAAANELRAGTTFRFQAMMTQTGTNAAQPTVRVRVGTTTLTGNIAATLTGITGAAATPSVFEGLITVRTSGAGGTVIGGLSHVKQGNLTAVDALAATVAVDTTVANLIELTLISGNAAVTYNVQVAEIVKDKV